MDCWLGDQNFSDKVLIMNCRQASRLLPLWVGHDLADSLEAEALQVHLSKCPDCSMQRRQLQSSLDALQSISTTSSAIEASAPSLWPRLAMVLTDIPRRRDQFNGWIPAAAMAMAAAVMVAVSVVQVQRDMGTSNQAAVSQDPPNHGRRNLFETDPRFVPGNGRKQDLQIRGLVANPSPNF